MPCSPIRLWMNRALFVGGDLLGVVGFLLVGDGEELGLALDLCGCGVVMSGFRQGLGSGAYSGSGNDSHEREDDDCGDEPELEESVKVFHGFLCSLCIGGCALGLSV